MKIQEKTIGFIGAGNMAEAIIGGLVKSGNASNIIACDINKERLDYIKNRYGTKTAASPSEAFLMSDVVILSVKPQVMETVLRELADGKQGKKGHRIIISIAAGIRIETFESILYKGLTQTDKKNLPIIRVMPNTPGLVLSGMSAVCANSVAGNEEIEIAETILSSMGQSIRVDEEKMNAVTAVSGSGPAYFFYFIESMIEEAVSQGLSTEEAMTLSVTTMKGAAELLFDSSDSPEVLRQKVTSPGGTTEAAMKIMEKAGMKNIFRSAIAAAVKRSKELSEA